MKNPKKFFEITKDSAGIKLPVMLSARDIYQVLEDEIIYYRNHNPAKEAFQSGFIAGLKAAQKHVIELTKIEKQMIKERRDLK